MTQDNPKNAIVTKAKLILQQKPNFKDGILFKHLEGLALGDYIVYRPYFHFCKKVFGNPKITICVKPFIKNFINYIDGNIVDEYILLNDHNSINNLENKNFYALIDTTRTPTVKYENILMANAKIKIKFAMQQLQGYNYSQLIFKDPTVYDNFVSTSLNRFFRILSKREIPNLSLKICEDKLHENKLISKVANKYVIINIGGAQALRRWPINNYINVIKYIFNQGLDVVILGGPAQVADAKIICEHPLLQKFSNAITDLTPYKLMEDSPALLIDVIQKASYFIGNDTGLTHVSMAVGTPTLWICLNKEFYIRWHPWPKYLEVGPAVYCIAEDTRHWTMPTVRSEHVISRFEELVELTRTWRQQSPSPTLEEQLSIFGNCRVELKPREDIHTHAQQWAHRVLEHEHSSPENFIAAAHFTPLHGPELDACAADCIEQKKEFGEAIELLQKAVELEPDSIIDNRAEMLAECLRLTKRFAECLRICERALAVNDSLVWAYWKQSQALEGLGRRVDAIAAVYKCITMDPLAIVRGPGEHLAELLRKNKDYFACAQIAQEAIHRAPTFACAAWAWFKLSQAQAGQGDIESAIFSGCKMFENEPHTISSNRGEHLAELYLKDNNINACVKIAHKALWLNAQTAWAWMKLSQAHYARNHERIHDHETAIMYAERAFLFANESQKRSWNEYFIQLNKKGIQIMKEKINYIQIEEDALSMLKKIVNFTESTRAIQHRNLQVSIVSNADIYYLDKEIILEILATKQKYEGFVVSFDSTQRSRQCAFLNMLRPYDIKDHKKIRVGGNKDGGYVMIEPKNCTEKVAYSFGISHFAPWDLEMANKGFKVYQYDGTIQAPPDRHENLIFTAKNIGVTTDDNKNIISVDDILKVTASENKNAILQVDIENAEWAMLQALSLQTLKRFKQIIIEFHKIDTAISDDFEDKQRIINKILNTHIPIHVHYNNYGNITYNKGIFFCNTFEVSFYRIDDEEYKPIKHDLPSLLDRPNNPNLADIPVRFES